jgi:hypothetical protein
MRRNDTRMPLPRLGGFTSGVFLTAALVGCGDGCQRETPPPASDDGATGFVRPTDDPSPAFAPIEPPGTIEALYGTGWLRDGTRGTWERVVFGEASLFLRTATTEHTVRLAPWVGEECLGYPACALLHGGSFRNAIRHVWTDGTELRFVQCVGLPPQQADAPSTPEAIAEANNARLVWSSDNALCLDFGNEVYRRETPTPVELR